MNEKRILSETGKIFKTLENFPAFCLYNSWSCEFGCKAICQQMGPLH